MSHCLHLKAGANFDKIQDAVFLSAVQIFPLVSKKVKCITQSFVACDRDLR